MSTTGLYLVFGKGLEEAWSEHTVRLFVLGAAASVDLQFTGAGQLVPTSLTENCTTAASGGTVGCGVDVLVAESAEGADVDAGLATGWFGDCTAFDSVWALLSKALPSAFPRVEPVLAAALPAAELPIAASAVAWARAEEETRSIRRTEPRSIRRDMRKSPPLDTGSVLPLLSGVNWRAEYSRKARPLLNPLMLHKYS